MSVSESNGGTVTTDGTEQTLFTNTTAGRYRPSIDLRNMVNNDSIVVKLKQKIRSGESSRVCGIFYFSNAQGTNNELFFFPVQDAAQELVMTIQRLSGSDRSYVWANTRLDPVQDVNLATWLGVAPLALSSQQVQVLVNAYASGQAPLQPTTAGRTLDVTANGNAGIDWNNVDNPTTTLNLSGTTVKTATDIATQVAALNNLSSAQAQSAAAAALTAYGATTEANATSNTNSILSAISGLSIPSAAAIATAVWDKATSALTTVGSIGKFLVDRIDVVLSTRLASADYTVPPTVVQIRQEMDSNSVDLNSILSNQTTINNNVLQAITDIAAVPTAVENRQEMDSNSTKLDVAVSTRLASASYTAPDNAGITAIKAKTDLLNFTGTDVKATLDGETVTVGTNNDKTGYSISDTGLSTTLMHKIADRILRRDLSEVETSSDGQALTLRSLLWAASKLNNRVRSNSNTFSIYKTDDTTVLFTQAETHDAAATPIVELNTA